MEYFFPFTTSCDVSWWINYKITYDSKLLHRFVYYVFLDCEFSPVSSWSIIGYLDCHSSLIFYTGILFIRLHFMVLFPNIMAISRAFFFDLCNTFCLWSSGIRSYYDQWVFIHNILFVRFDDTTLHVYPSDWSFYNPLAYLTIILALAHIPITYVDDSVLSNLIPVHWLELDTIFACSVFLYYFRTRTGFHLPERLCFGMPN